MRTGTNKTETACGRCREKYDVLKDETNWLWKFRKADWLLEKPGTAPVGNTTKLGFAAGPRLTENGTSEASQLGPQRRSVDASAWAGKNPHLGVVLHLWRRLDSKLRLVHPRKTIDTTARQTHTAD
jgi:hypothetical protein